MFTLLALGECVCVLVAVIILVALVCSFEHIYFYIYTFYIYFKITHPAFKPSINLLHNYTVKRDFISHCQCLRLQDTILPNYILYSFTIQLFILFYFKEGGKRTYTIPTILQSQTNNLISSNLIMRLINLSTRLFITPKNGEYKSDM